MFSFFKKKEAPKTKLEEEIDMIRSDAADYAEFQYRMEHDPEFKKSVEEGRAFLEADRIAREKAGITGKPGKYSFTCPHCGSECWGEWSMHISTGCKTCNISLRS